MSSLSYEDIIPAPRLKSTRKLITSSSKGHRLSRGGSEALLRPQDIDEKRAKEQQKYLDNT